MVEEEKTAEPRNIFGEGWDLFFGEERQLGEEGTVDGLPAHKLTPFKPTSSEAAYIYDVLCSTNAPDGYELVGALSDARGLKMYTCSQAEAVRTLLFDGTLSISRVRVTAAVQLTLAPVDGDFYSGSMQLIKATAGMQSKPKPIKWDAEQPGPDMAFLDENRGVTRTNSSGWGVQRGPLIIGKQTFTIKVDAHPDGNNYLYVGAVSAGHSLSNSMNGSSAWAWQADGYIYDKGSHQKTVGRISQGDIITIKVDVPAGKMEMSRMGEVICSFETIDSAGVYPAICLGADEQKIFIGGSAGLLDPFAEQMLTVYGKRSGDGHFAMTAMFADCKNKPEAMPEQFTFALNVRDGAAKGKWSAVGSVQGQLTLQQRSAKPITSLSAFPVGSRYPPPSSAATQVLGLWVEEGDDAPGIAVEWNTELQGPDIVIKDDNIVTRTNSSGWGSAFAKPVLTLGDAVDVTFTVLSHDGSSYLYLGMMSEEKAMSDNVATVHADPCYTYNVNGDCHSPDGSASASSYSEGSKVRFAWDGAAGTLTVFNGDAKVHQWTGITTNLVPYAVFGGSNQLVQISSGAGVLKPLCLSLVAEDVVPLAKLLLQAEVKAVEGYTAISAMSFPDCNKPVPQLFTYRDMLSGLPHLPLTWKTLTPEVDAGDDFIYDITFDSEELPGFETLIDADEGKLQITKSSSVSSTTWAGTFKWQQQLSEEEAGEEAKSVELSRPMEMRLYAAESKYQLAALTLGLTVLPDELAASSSSLSTVTWATEPQGPDIVVDGMSVTRTISSGWGCAVSEPFEGDVEMEMVVKNRSNCLYLGFMLPSSALDSNGAASGCWSWQADGYVYSNGSSSSGAPRYDNRDEYKMKVVLHRAEATSQWYMKDGDTWVATAKHASLPDAGPLCFFACFGALEQHVKVTSCSGGGADTSFGTALVALLKSEQEGVQIMRPASILTGKLKLEDVPHGKVTHADDGSLICTIGDSTVTLTHDSVPPITDMQALTSTGPSGYVPMMAPDFDITTLPAIGDSEAVATGVLPGNWEGPLGPDIRLLDNNTVVTRTNSSSWGTQIAQNPVPSGHAAVFTIQSHDGSSYLYVGLMTPEDMASAERSSTLTKTYCYKCNGQVYTGGTEQSGLPSYSTDAVIKFVPKPGTDSLEVVLNGTVVHTWVGVPDTPLHAAACFGGSDQKVALSYESSLLMLNDYDWLTCDELAFTTSNRSTTASRFLIDDDVPVGCAVGSNYIAKGSVQLTVDSAGDFQFGLLKLAAKVSITQPVQEQAVISIDAAGTVYERGARAASTDALAAGASVRFRIGDDAVELVVGDAVVHSMSSDDITSLLPMASFTDTTAKLSLSIGEDTVGSARIKQPQLTSPVDVHWSTTPLGPDIVLSEDDRVITRTSSSGWGCQVGDAAAHSGRFNFNIRQHSGDYLLMGVVAPSSIGDLSSCTSGWTGDGMCVQTDGDLYVGGSKVTNIGSFSAGAVLSFVINDGEVAVLVNGEQKHTQSLSGELLPSICLGGSDQFIELTGTDVVACRSKPAELPAASWFPPVAGIDLDGDSASYADGASGRKLQLLGRAVKEGSLTFTVTALPAGGEELQLGFIRYALLGGMEESTALTADGLWSVGSTGALYHDGEQSSAPALREGSVVKWLLDGPRALLKLVVDGNFVASVPYDAPVMPAVSFGAAGQAVEMTHCQLYGKNGLGVASELDAPLTWDAGRLGPSISLSGGNKDITRTSSSGWGVQLGSQPLTGGTLIFTINTHVGNSYLFVGIADAEAKVDLSGSMQNDGFYSLQADGVLRAGSSQVADSRSFGSGDVVTFTVTDGHLVVKLGDELVGEMDGIPPKFLPAICFGGSDQHVSLSGDGVSGIRLPEDVVDSAGGSSGGLLWSASLGPDMVLSDGGRTITRTSSSGWGMTPMSSAINGPRSIDVHIDSSDSSSYLYLGIVPTSALDGLSRSSLTRTAGWSYCCDGDWYVKSDSSAGKLQPFRQGSVVHLSFYAQPGMMQVDVDGKKQMVVNDLPPSVTLLVTLGGSNQFIRLASSTSHIWLSRSGSAGLALRQLSSSSKQMNLLGNDIVGGGIAGLPAKLTLYQRRQHAWPRTLKSDAAAMDGDGVLTWQASGRVTSACPLPPASLNRRIYYAEVTLGELPAALELGFLDVGEAVQLAACRSGACLKVKIGEEGVEAGDVIGLGLLLESRTVFFTRNGKQLGRAQQVSTLAQNSTLLMLSATAGTAVTVNLGTSDFVFTGMAELETRSRELLVLSMLGDSTDLAPRLALMALFINDGSLSAAQQDIKLWRSAQKRIYTAYSSYRLLRTSKFLKLYDRFVASNRFRQRAMYAMLHRKLDAVEKKLSGDGWKAEVLDGMRPLHMALARRLPAELVLKILAAQPEAAKEFAHRYRGWGGGGERRLTLSRADGRAERKRVLQRTRYTQQLHSLWYPLHYALRYGASKEVIAALLSLFPEAASMTAAFYPVGGKPAPGQAGMSPLALALRYGADDAVVGALLDAYPDAISICDKRGNLPLHLASRSGSTVALGRLLKRHSAAATAVNVFDSTPLHLAFNSRRPMPSFALKRLLKAAPDALRAADRWGQTPLHKSLSAGRAHEENAKELVAAATADDRLLLTKSGYTPLAMALRHNCTVDMLQRLLAVNGDAQLRTANKYDWLPLHFACLYSRSAVEAKVVRTVFEAFPDASAATNNAGCLPLHYALRRRLPTTLLMAMLEAAEAAPTVRSAKGRYLLHEALLSRADMAVSTAILARNGGAAAVPEPEAGMLPLHIALHRRQPHFTRIATKVLEAHPAACGAMDSAGVLPLHYLLNQPFGGEAEATLAMAMLEQATDVCSVALHSDFPLQLALKNGWPDGVVSALMDATAVAAADGDGNTALHLAVMKQRSPELCAALLAAHEAAASRMNAAGAQPLAYALQRRDDRYGDLLLALLRLCPEAATGSGPDVGNRDRDTPIIHLALRYCSSEDVLQLLLQEPVVADIADSRGWMPLHTALIGGQSVAVLKRLVEMNAEHLRTHNGSVLGALVESMQEGSVVFTDYHATLMKGAVNNAPDDELRKLALQGLVKLADDSGNYELLRSNDIVAEYIRAACAGQMAAVGPALAKLVLVADGFRDEIMDARQFDVFRSILEHGPPAAQRIALYALCAATSSSQEQAGGGEGDGDGATGGAGDGDGADAAEEEKKDGGDVDGAEAGSGDKGGAAVAEESDDDDGGDGSGAPAAGDEDLFVGYNEAHHEETTTALEQAFTRMVEALNPDNALKQLLPGVGKPFMLGESMREVGRRILSFNIIREVEALLTSSAATLHDHLAGATLVWNLSHMQLADSSGVSLLCASIASQLAAMAPGDGDGSAADPSTTVTSVMASGVVGSGSSGGAGSSPGGDSSQSLALLLDTMHHVLSNNSLNIDLGQTQLLLTELLELPSVTLVLRQMAVDVLAIVLHSVQKYEVEGSSSGEDTLLETLRVLFQLLAFNNTNLLLAALRCVYPITGNSVQQERLLEAGLIDFLVATLAICTGGKGSGGEKLRLLTLRMTRQLLYTNASLQTAFLASGLLSQLTTIIRDGSRTGSLPARQRKLVLQQLRSTSTSPSSVDAVVVALLSLELAVGVAAARREFRLESGYFSSAHAFVDAGGLSAALELLSMLSAKGGGAGGAAGKGGAPAEAAREEGKRSEGESKEEDAGMPPLAVRCATMLLRLLALLTQEPAALHAAISSVVEVEVGEDGEPLPGAEAAASTLRRERSRARSALLSTVLSLASSEGGAPPRTAVLAACALSGLASGLSRETGVQDTELASFVTSCTTLLGEEGEKRQAYVLHALRVLGSNKSNHRVLLASKGCVSTVLLCLVTSSSPALHLEALSFCEELLQDPYSSVRRYIDDEHVRAMLRLVNSDSRATSRTALVCLDLLSSYSTEASQALLSGGAFSQLLALAESLLKAGVAESVLLQLLSVMQSLADFVNSNRSDATADFRLGDDSLRQLILLSQSAGAAVSSRVTRVLELLGVDQLGQVETLLDGGNYDFASSLLAGLVSTAAGRSQLVSGSRGLSMMAPLLQKCSAGPPQRAVLAAASTLAASPEFADALEEVLPDLLDELGGRSVADRGGESLAALLSQLLYRSTCGHDGCSDVVAHSTHGPQLLLWLLRSDARETRGNAVALLYNIVVWAHNLIVFEHREDYLITLLMLFHYEKAVKALHQRVHWVLDRLDIDHEHDTAGEFIALWSKEDVGLWLSLIDCGAFRPMLADVDGPALRDMTLERLSDELGVKDRVVQRAIVGGIKRLLNVSDTTVDEGSAEWFMNFLDAVYPGRYRFDGAAAQGGMATVLMVEDTERNSKVAVKFYASLDAFETESATLRALQHENIIELQDAVEDPEGVNHMLVFERGDETLADLIERSALDVVDIKLIFKKICDGVKAMHVNKFVHMDLKPKNILRVGMTWKLIDMDSATEFGKPLSFKYTPDYAAPELVRAEMEGGELAAHPSYDVYTLGITLFEMFERATPGWSEDMDKLAAGELSLPLDRIADEQARHLLEKMCNPDPSKRPPIERVLGHAFIVGGSDTQQKWEATGLITSHLEGLSDKMDIMTDKLDAQFNLILNVGNETVPSTFLVLPMEDSGWKSKLLSPGDFLKKKYTLHFVCQWEGEEHCADHPGYEMVGASDVLKKVLPAMKITIKLLKVASLAGRLCGLPIPAVADVMEGQFLTGLSDMVETVGEMADGLLEGEDGEGSKLTEMVDMGDELMDADDDLHELGGSDDDDEMKNAKRVCGPALRALEAFLEADGTDPKKTWGNLHKCAPRWDNGGIRWLCEKHKARLDDYHARGITDAKAEDARLKSEEESKAAVEAAAAARAEAASASAAAAGPAEPTTPKTKKDDGKDKSKEKTTKDKGRGKQPVHPAGGEKDDGKSKKKKGFFKRMFG